MLRVIFFGMTGNFSVRPLEMLISTDLLVEAVIIPASLPITAPLPRRLEPPLPVVSDIPIINSYLEQNILHQAWKNQIPVWEVGNLSDRGTLEMVAAFGPDLIIVACFPYLFPQVLLQLPRYGCLNLHPSLLPAYRGPAPLFWMARQGERQAGVTLHFMDEGLDTGDIVAQTTFAWPDGISEWELEQRCAEEGAKLVEVSLQQLALGQALRRQPQSPEESSHFPAPSEHDFIIPTHWEARRAYNFLCAAESWPLAIKIGAEYVPVRIAIGYEPEQTLDFPCIFSGDELWVQFRDGILKVKI